MTGDHPALGNRHIAVMCEDCSAGKAGPTWIAHRLMDPDLADTLGIPFTAALVRATLADLEG